MKDRSSFSRIYLTNLPQFRYIKGLYYTHRLLLLVRNRINLIIFENIQSTSFFQSNNAVFWG